MPHDIYTIGHSTQAIEDFVRLLRKHEITALADVRSSPYSQRNPQFNRETLADALKGAGIRYVFLGKELGARSEDEGCYIDHKVQYSLLAKTPLFQSGIGRVIEGAATHRVALMCAEKDPLDCHRTILVSRELVKQGCTIVHILSGGSLEPHEAAMSRLVLRLRIGEADMFRSHDSAVEEAYEKQGHLIAYDRNAHRPGAAKGAPLWTLEGERQ